MKKYVVWGAVLVSLVVWAVHVVGKFESWRVLCWWNKDFMCLGEVCKRWGDRPLNVEEFRTNGEENRYLRARMACSLLKNQKQYVGMEVSETREKFGLPDGYYVSEAHPAYLISGAEEGKADVWQILFLSTNGRIDEIVVHRCC